MEPKIIRSKLNIEEKKELLRDAGEMIKFAVDIERRIISLGGDLHIDCYNQLLEDGSRPDDVWGANLYPAVGRIDFISMVNIRPPLARSMEIQDAEIRRKIEEIIKTILL